METVTLTIEVYGNCYVCHINLLLLNELKIHYRATITSGYVPWMFINLLRPKKVQVTNGIKSADPLGY